MHVISKRPFTEAATNYPNDADALMRTYRLLDAAEVALPTELKKIFGSLDNFKYEDRWWVIDIGGNNLRLIAFIDFRTGWVLIKHIVTHADYDRICKKYRER
ncbi:type II toxin-antitoxin system HigB family toxin [Luteibacter aegosomatissinici]|uniref:type II toxin-antitoxin system HigB family toxin n=1 Tax=Luteibacter aegosomatissinici TaxID=2911539 RepID=UPI001FF97F89|nr:type II toxin-antitoxin system HigB family toxin [Luteibacter aegosomatissinici]UPG92834.1 type II toxin-antitoxin system HigB family toxin [Luteibacter aegosomatissinici]